MKSLSIVRNCLHRYVARSKKEDFSVEEPRTLMIVFVLTLSILLAGVWVQLSASAGGSVLTGSKGGKKAPHTIEISGEIQSDPISVNLNPDNPLGNLNLDDVVLTFPTNTTGTTCGCTEDDTGCGDSFVDGWGGYASNSPWTGPLGVRKTKQKGTEKWNVSFNEGTNDIEGNINLVIQAQATETKSGDTATLEFTKARGLVGALSSPDGSTIDPDNRCLTFCITATKIP